MNISFFDKAASYFPDNCFERAVDLGILLGSGWGEALEMDEVIFRASYADIPGLGASTVAGHVGEFVLYRRGEKRIAAWCGRRHYYEGVGWEPVVLPIEMLRRGQDPSVHPGEYFLGEMAGPMGTASAALLVMAGLWLYMSGNLAWQCVASFSLATAVVSFAIPYPAAGTAFGLFYDLLSGSTFFCCVFMAACPYYCPKLATARYVWGGICGALSVLIQHFGSVEAGGAFAVLLMCPLAVPFDRMVWTLRSRDISWRTVWQAIAGKSEW